MDTTRSKIDTLLAEKGSTTAALEEVLAMVLAAFDCAVGTIHSLNRDMDRLELAVQKGIPGSILEQVRSIPLGKGMAGLAALRREPVQVCNLQKDTSGDARPGAKETRMEGSIAIPMLVDGELRGTLGVAKPVVYEFSREEIAELVEIARTIGLRLC